jgi:aminodeoxyfutalosine deaminase
MLAFRARYVFPIDSPPVRDGVVAIDHDRIVAIGESSSPEIHDLLAAARDLGDVAVLPGFVNSHTHLELSDLKSPLGTSGMPFPDWIRLVVDWKRERDRQSSQRFKARGRGLFIERIDDPIGIGIEQLVWSGVTAVGEIDSKLRSYQSGHPVVSTAKKNPLPLEMTSFLEFIALPESVVESTKKTLVADLVYARRQWNAEVLPGVSPHAPYTVHPELLRFCVRKAWEQKIPLAHHLAESREELMLLHSGRGPFVKLLEDFDAWDSRAIPIGSKPLDYLENLAKSHRALVIHGNYLDDEEIGFLAAHAEKMSVVYCPRTHAYFQHDPYPLAKMIAAGVNVAIGTDSRASNPDLSVLADMRFAAQQHPLVPPATLLRMITANAAKALGRDDEIGTLTPGKFADLAIMKLPRRDAVDPHELLFDPDCCITATIFRGGVVHGQLTP